MTFFNEFGKKWASEGSVEPISETQKKSGWDFLGSVPPISGQFNQVQQRTDEKINYLFNLINSFVISKGGTLTAVSTNMLRDILNNLLMAVQGGHVGYATKDGMLLDTTQAEKTIAEVLSDPVAENNGFYLWTSGEWVKQIGPWGLAMAATDASRIAAEEAAADADAAKTEAQTAAGLALDAQTDIHTNWQEKLDTAAQQAGIAAAIKTEIRNWYYGPLEADPVTRPDGTPVQVGDEYHDSVNHVRKVYSNGAWQDVSAAALALPGGAALVGYKSTTVRSALDDMSDLADDVDLVQEVVRLNAPVQDMLVSKNESNRLLITYRGADERLRQWTINPDNDGIFQTRSSKIGGEEIRTIPTGQRNQIQLGPDFLTPNINAYTVVVGSQFTGSFTGTGFVFRHYADSRGGVWLITPDGDATKSVGVSTWSSGPVTTKDQQVVFDIEDGEHSFTAEFVGADPDHPATGDGPRGWVRYSPDEALNIENVRLGPQLAFEKTRQTVQLNGLFTVPNENAFTTTVGDSFSFQFVGEELIFNHVLESRGGVWSFVIDSLPPVEVSTWGETLTNASTVVATGLENSLHTGVATFIGADPAHPPSDGTARGWLKYLAYEPRTLRVYPRPKGDTFDMLAPSSVLEWAIRCRPLDEPTWPTTWSPRHGGTEMVSQVLNTKILIDGVEHTPPYSDLSAFFREASSVVIEQIYRNICGSDTAMSKPMWEGWKQHTFMADGTVRFEHKFTVLRDLQCDSGYALMAGVNPETQVANNGRGEVVNTRSGLDETPYEKLSANVRLEYHDAGDRYMFAARAVTSPTVWGFGRLANDGRKFFTTHRFDANKSYILTFSNETLPAGYEFRSVVDYVIGEQK